MNTQSVLTKRHFKLVPAFIAGFLLGLSISILLISLRSVR